MPITLRPTMAKAAHAFHGADAAHAAPWRSRTVGRPLTLAIGSLALMFLAAPGWAAGFGDIRVQSALGQPLRASIGLLGDDAGGKLGTCFSARLNTADGGFIVAPRIALAGATPGANAVLNLSTSMALSEPAVTLVVEIGCGDAIRKEFALLLDPPMYLSAGAAGATDARDASSSRGVRQGGNPAPSAPAAAVQPASAPRAAPARPKQVATPMESAPAPEPVAATRAGAPAAAPSVATPPAATPPKNVLRLGARNGSDVDLVNAIGLRLALADRLANETASRKNVADGAPIPDLAKSAADRAARARFAAALRDQPDAGGDAALQATELKLQALQAKMQMLEVEAAKLREPAVRDAAAPATATGKSTAGVGRTAEPASGTDWLPILAGVLAVALLVIGWLVVRMKRMQHDNAHWDWEENVSAADARVTDGSIEQASGREKPDFGTASDRFAPASVPTQSGPGVHATSSARDMLAAAVPVADRSTPTSAPAPAIVAPQVPAQPKPRVAGTPAATGAPLAFRLDNLAAGSAAAGLAAAASSAAMSAALLPSTQLAPVEENSNDTGEPAATTGTQDDLQFAGGRSPQPAVEEISDAMQEAEFWISLHDSQRAVEVLEPYATADQPGSPLPWLYLFDLYRELGQRTKYDRLHERFQGIFNGNVPSWTELDESPAMAAPRSLEDMPHVSQKIAALWQGDQIVPYLESLLVDDREGNRVGFDLSIYREIMFLISMAYDLQQSKKYIKPAIGTPGWTLAA